MYVLKLLPTSHIKYFLQLDKQAFPVGQAVLGVIASYQKWGQTEKASAFERKITIEKLKLDLKNLDDRNAIKNIMKKKFSFIDFEKKMMKNSNETFTHIIVKPERNSLIRY